MNMQLPEFRYVSIDIETTGLDTQRCEILEIGAIITDPYGDLPEPEFHVYPHLDDDIYWESEAYEMAEESGLLRRREEEELTSNVGFMFWKWLNDHDMPTDGFVAAGKNFAGFDNLFLQRIYGWKENLRAKHRVLDPAIMYWRPEIDGVVLPNLQTCLQRADMDDVVTHCAVDDARCVANLVNQHIRAYSPTTV